MDKVEEKYFESLLDAKEVKKLLKCSLPWVYKAADRGLLPCVRIPSPVQGKRLKAMVRFKRNDIFDFIEKHYSST